VLLEAQRSGIVQAGETSILVVLIGVLVGGQLGILLGVSFALAVVVGIVSQTRHAVDRQARNAADTAQVAACLGASLPGLGQWAIEGDFGQLIACEIQSGRRTIVEFGSGVSTLIAAAQLRTAGCGRLFTVEHDAGWLEVVDHRLAAAGLSDWVELIESSLIEQAFNTARRTERISWYDRTAILPRLPREIDLLVVDGPPAVTSRTRWPAVALAHEQLADNAVILMDDGRRRHERQIAFRWQTEYPDLELYWQDTVKGTWRLRRATNPQVETAVSKFGRVVVRTLHPRPAGFGRWPVRR
jgi:hypothetical protein